MQLHQTTPQRPPTRGHAPQSRSPRRWWVVVAVCLVIVVGGLVAAVSVGSGGDPDDVRTGLTPKAIDRRYTTLAESITHGTRGCTHAPAKPGRKEVLTCPASAGTLTLTTYSSATALEQARRARLDARVGTTSNDAGVTAYYTYDPSQPVVADHSAPALVYWDNAKGLQSALLTGGRGVGLSILTASLTPVKPTAGPARGPVDAVLSDFIGHWLDASTCKQTPLLDPGAEEEVVCRPTGASSKGITVLFGRFPTAAQELEQRALYAEGYGRATQKRGGGRWHFPPERRLPGGLYYSYRLPDHDYLTFWDWAQSGCQCWAVALYRGKADGLSVLEKWWTAGSQRA